MKKSRSNSSIGMSETIKMILDNCPLEAAKILVEDLCMSEQVLGNVIIKIMEDGKIPTASKVYEYSGNDQSLLRLFIEVQNAIDREKYS